jgi:hypothetical protein
MSIFRVVVAGGSIAVLHEKEVVLRDATLAPKRTLPLASTSMPVGIALSPDGERVASCFESGISLEGRAFSGDERWARESALAWTTDAIWALREPAGEVFVLDPKTLGLRARGALDWGDEARITLVGHPEGHVYAVGAEGQHGAETHALVVSGDRVVDVILPELRDAYWIACTPSGARIASQTADGIVTIRDAATLAPVDTTKAPDSFVIVGFVDETHVVIANDNELRILEVPSAPVVKAAPVSASVLARVPPESAARSEPDDRGTRLLTRLLETGGIELVKRADKRELAEHLDELFASRRMTAETIANVLEDHDSVAELYADDDTIAALLTELIADS